MVSDRLKSVHEELSQNRAMGSQKDKFADIFAWWHHTQSSKNKEGLLGIQRWTGGWIEAWGEPGQTLSWHKPTANILPCGLGVCEKVGNRHGDAV